MGRGLDAHAKFTAAQNFGSFNLILLEFGNFAFAYDLLAALDLQIAPTDSVVVAREDQIALKRMAFNWLKAELEDFEGK